MKKPIALILTLVTLFTLSACGSATAATETPQPAQTPAVTSSTASGSITEIASVNTPDPAVASAEADIPPAKAKIDVDLTQLSSTMVYSEVYAMMYEPEQYIGKTVKMQGVFSTQEFNNIRYFACIVQDATACCAQGLEFQLKDSYVYPDDYPEPGTEITVVGTFDTYLEENDGKSYFYIYLKDAVLESQDSGQNGQQTGS